ncbi:MAG: 4a-hydroxytetrahydrobiopterin dehydratase [candidate division Zixibacteria bacterium]|nr:4a-hydroxytetrahydrobiopterin dehydratase [candidate division Zixibacteria bacterium]MBU1471931.1 4a-hydroxytetrahydrobiopterin dehydratase [candidate division Zixibacteria bacterium]MBU2626106.1 4a-hydroxytetrahydrobiopterin dehydratase [candidate division Zixibacteria bacterium]
MSESLRIKKCVPCEGGIEPMSDVAIGNLISRVPTWKCAEIEHSGKKIKTLQKTFSFKNFREAMAFLRKVEDIAESEGHHPDFCVHYSRVDFTIWTHAISGLHQNDFILASKTDELVEG